MPALYVSIKCLLTLSVYTAYLDMLNGAGWHKNADFHMHLQTRPSLVQIMACHLFGTKPLSEPMPTYYRLASCDQISVTFQSKYMYNSFYKRKWNLKILSAKWHQSVNTLRPRQNGRHFPDGFKWIFLNENVWISIEVSLKFVPKGPINNIPALVQIMAWRRPGDKPLSDPMMVSLLTHICVIRPQWINSSHLSRVSNSMG